MRSTYGIVAAWTAASTGAAGKSAELAVSPFKVITIFGNTSGATTLTVEYSKDNSTYYASDQTVAANGDFAKTFDCAAPYVRISSGTDRTVTAWIAGKA